ncbi:hypothetical protein [Desulfobacula sp.]|nr:hypothetical protein [Desulfobacula sp.]
MDTNKTIIKLEGISFAYPGESILFDRLGFEFSQGDRIGLVGSS